MTALGATAFGRIILGFDEHLPVGDLPLWAGDELTEEIKRHTAVDGAFSLTTCRPA